MLKIKHARYTVTALLVCSLTLCPSGSAKASAARLHPTHPEAESDPGKGLPDSCLTYEERYAGALSQKFSNRANAPQGHHDFAIISWGLWHGQDFLPDLLASLRVLAIEGHEAGYDVWFMYRVETGGSLTPEEYKRAFPADLQELVVLWDTEEVFALYDEIPNLNIFDHQGGGWQVESQLGYIPGTWFLHRFGAYQFAYMLESDIRFTAHWGKFLNAALNIAINRTGSEPADSIWAHPVKMDTAASTDLPDDLRLLPDLLNFVPLSKSDKWADTAVNMPEDKYESLFMLWGGSRKLFNAMHDWSRKGKAVYYESFMPTVAAAESLSMIAVDHPVWRSDQNLGHGTWHCCTLGARDVYEDWMKSKHCLHPGLLHPVKLAEPLWQRNSWEKWLAQ